MRPPLATISDRRRLDSRDLKRRLGPLNQERLKLLDAIEANSGKTPIPPGLTVSLYRSRSSARL